MTQKGNMIIADEGKVFKRTADGQNYGKEIILGYAYYIGGVKLDEPHKDTPEDFEEVDEDYIEPTIKEDEE